MNVKNRIYDLEGYKNTNKYPTITGISELHVFFEPINPSLKTVNKFSQICEEINEKNKDVRGFNKIKACHLCLHYKNVGDLRVMQSSRYLTSNDMDFIINECLNEADLIQKGFDDAYKNGEIDEKVNIIREKIEATASNKGVPQTNEESLNYPTKYFEFHIRLGRKNDDTITCIQEDEILELKELSCQFTEKFGTPVPLSFNQTNEHQRYLNVRFSQIGSEEAKAKVQEIVKAIDNSKNFKWIKTIAEYVWYDSNRALDSGWIDF